MLLLYAFHPSDARCKVWTQGDLRQPLRASRAKPPHRGEVLIDCVSSQTAGFPVYAIANHEAGHLRLLSTAIFE